MRTVLLVLVMMVVALAAGLSFVLRVGAQDPPAATLELACRSGQLRGAVPSGVATLVTCTATTRNTGTVPLVDAQLLFMPAANLPAPDFYYFWSEVRDGVRQAVGETQLAYGLGDIAPGGESVLVLEIIVRSAHEYGADLVLAARPDQREYARATAHGTAADVPPAIGLKLFRERSVDGPVSHGIMILNYTGAPYDAVSVEMSPGSDARIQGAREWRPVSGSAHVVADFGPLGADASIVRTFRIAPTSGDCVSDPPALVVAATQGGQVLHAAAIDDGALLDICGGGDRVSEGGGDAAALPAAGSGPPARGAAGRGSREVLLAAGVGALALGLGLRRRARTRS